MYRLKDIKMEISPVRNIATKIYSKILASYITTWQNIISQLVAKKDLIHDLICNTEFTDPALYRNFTKGSTFQNTKEREDRIANAKLFIVVIQTNRLLLRLKQNLFFHNVL